MSRKIIDSYTHQAVADVYVSAIPGIQHNHKTLYKVTREGSTASYQALRIADTDEWVLFRCEERRHTAPSLPRTELLAVESERKAREYIEFFLRHDQVMQFAVEQLMKANTDPLIGIVTQAMENLE